ncbi:MAG: transposase [Oligoflexales bacterium]|nr:transposase [Oligoflexales bacterium]
MEKLIGYVARPSISTDRMSLTPKGESNTKSKRNGTTHVLLSPLELIEKLCSLVPPHLLRFGGGLSPQNLSRCVGSSPVRLEQRSSKKKKKKRTRKRLIRDPGPGS